MTYPKTEGDFVVIGPDCFTSTEDPSVICYRGRNYYRDAKPVNPWISIVALIVIAATLLGLVWMFIQ